jgi:hypothetical protein
MNYSKIIIILALILVSIVILWDDTSNNFEQMSNGNTNSLNGLDSVKFIIKYIDENEKAEDVISLDKDKRKTINYFLSGGEKENVEVDGFKIERVEIFFLDKDEYSIGVFGENALLDDDEYTANQNILLNRKNNPKKYNPLSYLDFDIKIINTEDKEHSLKKFLNADGKGKFSGIYKSMIILRSTSFTNNTMGKLKSIEITK